MASIAPLTEPARPRGPHQRDSGMRVVDEPVCTMGARRCPDSDGTPFAARLALGRLRPVRSQSGLRWLRRDLAGPCGGVAVHLQPLGAIPPASLPIADIWAHWAGRLPRRS